MTDIPSDERIEQIRRAIAVYDDAPELRFKYMGAERTLIGMIGELLAKIDEMANEPTNSFSDRIVYDPAKNRYLIKDKKGKITGVVD